MDKTDAAKLLSYHSCRSENIQNTKWRNGFLGSLMPFEAILYEENFIDIMECLKVLSNELFKEKINNDLMRDIITIIYLGRCWTEKGGVLDLMGSISDEQSKQINEWITIIEDTVFNLLHGNIDKAFYKYDEYKKMSI
ncbi:hypothetical protein [Clostridium thailandense]|uniref:hypothetical protein n=1 Tax=Clostridium thailandense TaxID=2794346 RepID=UPI0039896D25